MTEKRRTRAQVAEARSGSGCCDQWREHRFCRCLEDAEPDPHPGKASLTGCPPAGVVQHQHQHLVDSVGELVRVNSRLSQDLSHCRTEIVTLEQETAVLRADLGALGKRRQVACIFCDLECRDVAELKRHSADCSAHPAKILAKALGEKCAEYSKQIVALQAELGQLEDRPTGYEEAYEEGYADGRAKTVAAIMVHLGDLTDRCTRCPHSPGGKPCTLAVGHDGACQVKIVP